MTIDVAILGATGMVGQRMVQLLAGHPTFRVRELCASDRSAGRVYGEAAAWRLPGAALLQDQVVRTCDPSQVASRVVFSAIDKSVAADLEPAFAARGYRVFSNASAHRMDADVPLLIPELNPDHAEMVRGRDGYVVTNPNCTSVPLVFALAPLHRAWGVEAVTCASYQAVSGAGYPGESAWDILDTVHPHPGDEEEKVAVEPRKILGARAGSQIIHAPFPISARCVRVPVVDGHLVAASIRLKGSPEISHIIEALRDFAGERRVYSTPSPLIEVTTRRDRPSPRLDAMAGAGMTITIGRIEPCEVFTVKLFALAHNTVRGAAGAAIGNAELLHDLGLV